MKREAAEAYLAIVVLALIWGYNWVAIKIATNNADAFFVAGARSVLGTLCLFAALIVTRRSLRPPPLFPTITLGIVQTSIFTMLQSLAVASGGAGKTAILAYTMPFWLVLLAWPLLHERLTPHGWIALVLAATGLGLVLAPFDRTGGLTSKAFALSAAIAWAVSAVYGKLLRRRAPTDLLALTTWQMFFGSIPLVVVAILVPHHRLNLTAPFVLSLLYVAVPGTGLAWLLWMFLLSQLSARVAGIASLLTPVVGVFSAWLQLGERPGTLELSGLACIVAALVTNVLPERRSRSTRVLIE